MPSFWPTCRISRQCVLSGFGRHVCICVWVYILVEIQAQEDPSTKARNFPRKKINQQNREHWRVNLTLGLGHVSHVFLTEGRVLCRTSLPRRTYAPPARSLPALECVWCVLLIKCSPCMCAVDIRFTFAELPDKKSKKKNNKGRTLSADFFGSSRKSSSSASSSSSFAYVCAVDICIN